MKKVYDRNLDENVIKEERLNLVCSKMSISAYNQSMVCDAVEYIMNQTVLIARNKIIVKKEDLFMWHLVL